MFKKCVILIVSCITFLVIIGCNNVVEEKADALTKTESNEERSWQQSPLFESGSYTMIGEEGHLGFIYDDSEVLKFYPNKTQKYMWHVWGDEQELDGKFTVIATNQNDGEQVPLLGVERLSGPNNGAERHEPSHLSLPKHGMWKMDAYIDDKLFGTIYVEVHKE